MPTQLYQTADVEEQWRTVVEPWLCARANEAWRKVRPTVVLTPSRAEGFYLRSRMVQERVPFLGIRFWTPSDARSFLLTEISPGIDLATEAELRLVARACAEKTGFADEPSLASVAREPGPFLRAYDLLLGAGWEPARKGAAYGRRLAGEMTRALADRKIATQTGMHRLLRAEQKKDEPLLAGLLVTGFNATHWPLWDLLQATVAASERTTVTLLAPRIFGEEVDQLWISSWEEATGGTVETPHASSSVDQGPFEKWIAAYERGEIRDAGSDDITFLATADLASQVDAVTLQALHYLKSDSCQRLAIVFPETDALALGVADQLRRLGVPLDDGTGYLQPGLFERRHWQAWLALQEEPSVERLTEWLRACAAEKVSCGMRGATFPARKMADELDEAMGDSLVDHLDFLALHLEEKEKTSRRPASSLGKFLRERVQLPDEGRFSEFFGLTCRALEALGWTDHLASVQTSAPSWLRESPWILSRRTFLEWLKESTDSRERTRGTESNHFYGKVHLLIYAQMPGQTWTHLILTGLNEGRWPRLFEAGAFGSRHELMALNRQARALNRSGVTQGGQGAGQEIIGGGRGHCLLPLERQDLALRDLCASIEGTSEAACLAAMTTDLGRMLLPSDFFNHAYQAKTGRVLDEDAFRFLARTTLEWTRRHKKLLRTLGSTSIDSPKVEATRIAYAARRDPEKPFSRYEFAYAEPPPEPIQLSCKTWETAWNHPASIWLGNVVGVEAWPEGRLGWPRAVGTWVHRWLAVAFRTCRETNAPDAFMENLRAAAERGRVRTHATAQRAGVALYPWWDHVWGQVRSVALGLGEALAPLLRERHFLSEWRLPENLKTTLPGTFQADFNLTGRIDLLLIEPGAVSFDGRTLTDCSCWVIDFKTGAAKNPSVEKGIGLQAMLYALAVREAGAAAVALSLHTFDTTLKPHLQIEQVLAGTELFRSLDRFHRDGIFGMRSDAENEYGFAPPYPMATRAIPSEVLKAKWALVHGAPVPEEEP